LAAQLRHLGVCDGDTVMVHASLRAVGPVDDGAAGVVVALEEAVGALGTIVMNVGAWDDFAWVNARPETERELLLQGAPAFDKDRTPADPDVGVLAEVFRRMPGTQVTDHPDGRFASRGHRAGSLLHPPLPWDDYYGPGSVLERLVHAGGKVLRLGADLDTVTLLHLAENLVEMPAKHRVLRHHKIKTKDGLAAIRTVSCLDDTDGIVEWTGEDYFAMILRDYLALGRAAVGPVGGARSELIDAADLLDHGIRWMRRNLNSADAGDRP